MTSFRYLAGATLAWLATACAGERYQKGTLFPDPLPRPAFALEGPGGQPYDFAANTRGKLTVLLFGYTSCPDVCPGQLTVLAEAQKRLSPEIRSNLRTVFVTTDPGRDTPDRLAQYLGRFEPSFVGLTGSIDSIQAAATRSAIPFVAPDTGAVEKSYEHFSSAIVISADDSVRLLMPGTATSQEWAADLNMLWKRYQAARP